MLVFDPTKDVSKTVNCKHYAERTVVQQPVAKLERRCFVNMNVFNLRCETQLKSESAYLMLL